MNGYLLASNAYDVTMVTTTDAAWCLESTRVLVFR